MRKLTIFFLILLLLGSTQIRARASNGYGEDSPALGQFTDDFVNETFIGVKYRVERNATLNAMELNYTSGYPLYEDFTTYTDFDPNNRVTQTADLITWTGSRRGDDLTYKNKDYGVGYFDQDFIYTWILEITDLEAGDGSSREHGYIVSMSNTINNINTDPHVSIEIQQNAADDTSFRLAIRIDDVHAGWDEDIGVWLDVGTPYFIRLERIAGDDLTVTIRTGSLGGPLIDTLVVSLVNFDDNFRYIYAIFKKKYTADVNDWISGTLQILWNQTEQNRYIDEGYFLTPNLLNFTNGESLVLLTNATISDDTEIRVQFSDDNSTWVNSSGSPGFNIVPHNFTAFDLRNLNYSDIYLNYTLMTDDFFITPRLYQSRLVSTENGAGAAAVIISESDAPWIALAIILSIIAFLLAMRIKR